MSNVGYIRVSSYGQNTDRQLVGIELDKVFEEKASAKDAHRLQLQECMAWVRDGDTLHVHSIDRLARNLSDLQKIVEQMTTKGVTVRFHKESLTFSGDHDPMQKLMLQMMGAFAEFERALINERRREGMALAKLKGKQIGAKKKLSDTDVMKVAIDLAKGDSKKSVADKYGISRQTLYNALNERGLLKRIDMAHTALIGGFDNQVIEKVLAGEITRLIEGDESNGWHLSQEVVQSSLTKATAGKK